MQKSITGFSRLSKAKKLQWIVENFFKDPEGVMKELMSYWLIDEEKQNLLDRFSENTISNFYLPYGVAPNFMINGRCYCVPMVIEESSVVAAAANAAKYWYDRGGFHAEIVGTEKIGQIHFEWPGNFALLHSKLPDLEKFLLSGARHLLKNMEDRGGGVIKLELLNFSDKLPDTYQMRVTFRTADSMGANFINSVLENFASNLINFVNQCPDFEPHCQNLDVLMSILSNYTPDCLVRAWVECPIRDLGSMDNRDSYHLARRFEKAVKIAQVDTFRAVTHNKGIFNGIDAVVLATANDFRAVEANGHAYASRHGQYRGLTDCEIDGQNFRFWIELPLAVGTVGGLTTLHPLARHSMELLGHPSAEELMMVLAVMGLAQNFAAIRSLVTTGIQKGHMKMHLTNMLASLNASEREIKQISAYFQDQVVSYADVRDFLSHLRVSTSNLDPSAQLSHS